MAGLNYNLLRDRSVIITGGASGLGADVAATFATHGAYITIADMQDDLGQTLAAKLGDRVSFVHCDTTDYTSSLAAFKHAVNHAPSKTLDIAVLFAGTDGERAGLVDLALENRAANLKDDPAPPLHRAIDVNLLGVYVSTYLALHYFRLPSSSEVSTPPLKKSLVLISSMTGYIDLPYNTGYATSKYGVRGLFRSIRSQGHKVNARINNIAPGYILTPLTRKVHRINDPSETSKATGTVLPWAPVEYVTSAVSTCVLDESVDGRSFLVVPGGVEDIEEDWEVGWGGEKFVELMKRDGFFELKSLWPERKGGPGVGV